MKYLKKILLICFAVAAGLSGFWQPPSTVANTAVTIVDKPALTPRASVASISSADFLVIVFGWKPLLYAAPQLRQLQGSSRNVVLVFVCPDESDVEDVRALISDAEDTPTTDVFLFPVTNSRVALLNGRYMLEASAAYLDNWTTLHPASDSKVTRVVLFDASRALLCNGAGGTDVFNVVSEDHAWVLPMDIRKKNRGLGDEYLKLMSLLSEPVFDSLAPPLSATPPLPAAAFAPQLLGGSLETVRRLLRKFQELTSDVQDGMAIEHHFSLAVRQCFKDSQLRPLASSVVSRRGAPCLKSPICGGALAPAKFPAVLLYHQYCDPAAPLTTSAPLFNVTLRTCPSLFASPLVSAVGRRPHLLPFLAERSKHIVPFWSQFGFQAPRHGSVAQSSPACHHVDLVLSFATGYSLPALRVFLTSFYKHHRKGATKLALIVASPALEDLRRTGGVLTSSEDVLLVDVSAYSNQTLLGKCPVVLSRIEVIRNFLKDQKLIPCVNRVMLVDSRDSAFQRDPFENVDSDVVGSVSRSLRMNTSYIVFPSERYFLSQHDFIMYGPHILNRYWIGQTFGYRFFYKLLRDNVEVSTAPKVSGTRTTFPILCGGLYYGTFDAVYDFLDVFVATAVALGGCSVNDQGLLVALVAVGLGESRFPHEVWLADPYTTHCTNGPRGGLDIVRDTNGRIVNCHNEPYAVLHQFDRHKAVWDTL